MIGPQGGRGEESFDVFVCTPRWLEENRQNDGVVCGRHMLIMFDYNYERLKAFFEKAAAEATGESWREVALSLSRIGKWEFEDYRESVQT